MNIYSFNASKALDECISWLRNYAKGANFNKVVLGISGGKDSTIAAALCCRAFGNENVHGLLLPNGEQKDIQDSYEVCDALGISYDIINIKPIYDSYILTYGLSVDKDKHDDGRTADQRLADLLASADKCTDEPILNSDALINLGPRVRMTTIRLWAQSHHYRMCGTGNFSEITVGYYTKDGDSCCDFNPLGRLTSVEVVEIGKLLEEIPKRLVLKTPNDGLSGMSDEEKLKVSYHDIHCYIRSIKIGEKEWYKINDLEKKNLHKRNSTLPMYIPSDSVLYKIEQ